MLDETGNVTERYLYGPDVDQLLAVDIAHETMWTLADNLGSIRAIVAIDEQTGDGHVIQRFSYTAFGQVQVILNDRTDIDIRFLYTGREWDAAVDLYHYRRRWYDPALQKFISEDPLGFAAGDENITRYVANRATNATDPSGLERVEVVDGVVFWVIQKPGYLYGTDVLRVPIGRALSGGLYEISDRFGGGFLDEEGLSRLMSIAYRYWNDLPDISDESQMRQFGAIREAVARAKNGPIPSFFSDAAQDATLVTVQQFANFANGLQHALVGVLNLPAAAINLGLWTENLKLRVPYIPSPVWSHDIAFPQDAELHGWSVWGYSMIAPVGAVIRLLKWQVNAVKAADAFADATTMQGHHRLALQAARTSGGQAEKAAIIRNWAEGKRSRLGDWDFFERVGTDGSIVFTGRAGEAIVVTADGRVYTGRVPQGEFWLRFFEGNFSFDDLHSLIDFN